MNLFISYSSKSREAVHQLASDLSDLGYTVWFDRELTGGHQWWAAILGQIRDCDVFVFALTPESLESFPCELEWKYARDCHKRILPVQLAEVRLASIPAGLQEIQLVDYREQGKSQQAALNRALVKLPPAKPLPDPLPAEPPTPLSPLVRFAEQIDAPTLSGDEQILLVAKLRPFLDDADTKADALALLKRFRRRDDLLARTADEIGRLLDEQPGSSSRHVSTTPAIPTRTEVFDLPLTGGGYCAVFSPMNDALLIGTGAGIIELYEVTHLEPRGFTLRLLNELHLQTGKIMSVAISSDNEWVLAGGDNGTAFLWQFFDSLDPTFKPRPLDLASEIRGAAFTIDNNKAIIGNKTGLIQIWPIVDKEPHAPAPHVPNRILKHGAEVRGLAVSPSGEWIASAGTDDTICLWDTTQGLLLSQIKGHSSSVNSVTFSPDSGYLLSGSSDWTVRLWDASNGKEIRQFLGHNGRVSGVAFAPDGKHIVSAAADKRAILWDVETGEEICHFVGHTDRINSVAFSPDGKYIVTASHDKTARVWETGL